MSTIDEMFDADERRTRTLRGAMREPIAKFNPNQPRVPAGSTKGGQFANSGGQQAADSSAGGSGHWSDGPDSDVMDKGRAQLEAAYPQAYVSVDIANPAEREQFVGAVDGLTRMAREFPGAAGEVKMIRFGTSGTTTDAIAEVKVVTFRRPGEMIVSPAGNRLGRRTSDPESGLAIVFNTQRMQQGLYDASMLANFDEAGASGLGYSQRANANAWSTKTPRAFGESIAVHEFGHVVHGRAVSEATGLNQVNGEGFWDTEHKAMTVGAGVVNRFAENSQLRYWNAHLDQAVTEPRDAVSGYGRHHRGEAFAEAFMTRNGPDGVDGNVHPALARVMDDMEGLSR